jgi:preprotein translocase subunit SecB
MLLSVKFSHRDDAFALPENTPLPEVPIQIEGKVSGGPGEKAVVFRLRAFTPPERIDLFYNLDVEIAAIISSIPGQENLDPFEYAKESGTIAFFPFLREAVANLTLKGRFGAIWLRPTNLLMAARQEQSEASADL